VSADAIPTFISSLIAVILTLLVFSRLAGDNRVFRFVQYLFVGVSLGYAFVVVYHQVLRPNALIMLRDLANPGMLGVRLLPFLLGLLLLTRIVGRQNISWMANIPLALLFGVAAALALGGALVGTLLPQLLDTVRPDQSSIATLLGSIFLVFGVVATLCYFYFTVPRDTTQGRLVALGARTGRWLLMIAFGFFFAGGLLTYLTALNDRLDFIVNFLRAPLG
jgi:hypothetical protein